jgi:hypothetical protein
MRIVTALGPHENPILPPARTAATTAADVQLRAVPWPITRVEAAASLDAGPAQAASALTHATAAARQLIAGMLGPGYAFRVAKRDRPPGSEPFDVTLPEGFELGEHRSELEAAAKQAGWTIERHGAVIAVRDVWTENEDHAAWLVATKVGLPLERVTVWAGRDP